jgi:hypothetical protein
LGLPSIFFECKIGVRGERKERRRSHEEAMKKMP